MIETHNNDVGDPSVEYESEVAALIRGIHHLVDGDHSFHGAHPGH